jgi:predicted DNA-binding antitoxin AbrB/MazE fold protein
VVIAIDAVYEGGVLKPKEPLDLPEQAEVRLTIETPAAATRTPLGRRLWALRAEILRSGAPPLDWEGIEQEVRARRGGWREEL